MGKKEFAKGREMPKDKRHKNKSFRNLFYIWAIAGLAGPRPPARAGIVFTMCNVMQHDVLPSRMRAFDMNARRSPPFLLYLSFSF